MKFKSLIISIGLLSMSIVIQAQEPVNYQQKFESAVDILDSCQECAVQQLLDIKAAQYAPETVRINSTIVLANVSVSIGNIESLDVFLKDIEQYIAQHPDDKNVSSTLERLKGNRSELGKQQESFRDRLVGTWVSAEVDNWTGDGAPETVIEIRKSENGELSATSYYYGTKTLPPDETNNIDIYGASKMIGIHFGTEKVKKADTEYAQALMNQVRQNASESAATKARTGYSDWGKDIGNIFLTWMAKDAATASTSYRMTDYFMKELAIDVLHGKAFYDYRYEQSDGKTKILQYVRDWYLYRITNEDSIVFSCSHGLHQYGYWPIHLNDHFEDYKTIKKNFPKGEKISVEEYNLKAYERLRNKIMKGINTLEESDAEWITNELIYGPEGYAWNDGYYYASEKDARNNRCSYDERCKGPYKRGTRGIIPVTSQETIHDYWKGFKREENFKEYFDFTKKFGDGGVPKWFKMKNDIDSKKNKKNNKNKEEEDEE